MRLCGPQSNWRRLNLMNFFEAQENARRATKRLIRNYFLVAAAIVVATTIVFIATLALFPVAVDSMLGSGRAVDWGTYLPPYFQNLFLPVAGFIALFIFLATMLRSAVLLKGATRVAVELGGTQLPEVVNDPLHRRLRNVVEEMAIASGIPTPDIYVLEKEESINAFASGMSPSDAALAVTRGALESLDRDELQGVVAHEFSHILNGDMRLNIRMMGLLFGFTAMHSLGRAVMVGGRVMIAGVGASGLRVGKVGHELDASDNKVIGGMLGLALLAILFLLMIGVFVIVFGAGFAVLGLIGIMSARAIKAAVAREREYLADASAVQFTRQTVGLANAMKKIRGHIGFSYITATNPEQITHMLFSQGLESARTHPPLHERIAVLERAFDQADAPRREAVSGKVASTDSRIEPQSIIDLIGQPGPGHVEYSRQLRQSIPDDLYDAAHSLERAYPLTVALILDRSGQQTERQMALVEEHFSAEQSRLVQSYQQQVANIDAQYRLPLLELAFPALKRRPDRQLVELVEFVDRVVVIDDKIDLYEYCFGRILRLNLRHVLNPSVNGKLYSRKERRAALVNLLIAVAQSGHRNPIEGQAALDAGRPLLGKWASNIDFDVNQIVPLDALDQSLDLLSGHKDRDFSEFLLAICTIAGHDGRLTATEAELVRVISETLDCPMPPILGERSASPLGFPNQEVTR